MGDHLRKALHQNYDLGCHEGRTTQEKWVLLCQVEGTVPPGAMDSSTENCFYVSSTSIASLWSSMVRQQGTGSLDFESFLAFAGSVTRGRVLQ